MKKLNPEQWEEKYVKEELVQFNQKNTMFSRNHWDTSIMDAIPNWEIRGTIKDSPGHHLEDWSLYYACRRGVMMGLFNSSKPNPSKLNKKFAKAASSVSPMIMSPHAHPPEGAKLQDSAPKALTKKVKKAALFFGASDVGICKLDRRWVYSHTYDDAGGGQTNTHGGQTGQKKETKSPKKAATTPQVIPDNYKYAVVMLFEQSYDLLSYYPNLVANAVSSLGYSNMAITSHYLSHYIRNLGFDVIDCTTNDVALSIPMAMQAGLGDIGRNGILISPIYGPRVRIAKILTDLPLVPDSPIDFGVTEFCKSCEICAEKCPSESIKYGDRTIEPNNISNARGGLKWPINAETCRMYWGKMNQGCSVCMANCPFNKPDTHFHRMVRWFIDYIRWGDPFYVWMDKLFGYGKPKPADNMWEDWEPKKRHVAKLLGD